MGGNPKELETAYCSLSPAFPPPGERGLAGARAGPGPHPNGIPGYTFAHPLAARQPLCKGLSAVILDLFSPKPDHPLADPKELQRTIAELPLDNTFRAVDEINGWLESLPSATDFRCDKLFAVVRALDEAAQPHLRRLTRDYLLSPRLSRTEEKRLWAVCAGFWADLAKNYETCLDRYEGQETGGEKRAADNLKSDLPLLLSRAIGALGVYCKWQLFRYGPIDGELWQRLGRLFLSAEGTGLGDKAVGLYPASHGIGLERQGGRGGGCRQTAMIAAFHPSLLAVPMAKVRSPRSSSAKKAPPVPVSSRFSLPLADLQNLADDAVRLARKGGASACEADVSEGFGQSVTVRQGEVETIEYNRDKGLGITVYLGQRKGYASTSDFSPLAVKQTVAAALDIARYTAEDPCAGLPEAKLLAKDWQDPGLYFPWDIPVEGAIDLARRCEAAAFAVSPLVKNSEGASLSLQEGQFATANSLGFRGGYPTSRHYIACSVITGEAGKNAAMARVLGEERGLRIVSGRTESHVFLVDLRAKKITGKLAEAALGKAHITVNKNAIPNDPEKPFVTSGIRIGSPAMTTRGFTELEAEQVAHLVADVLDAPEDEAKLAEVRAKVSALCAKFPVYGA